MKRLAIILPTGSALVKGSRSLAMPTHVFHLLATLPPDVQTHVVDMKMAYGIPLDTAGEDKVIAAFTADLDRWVEPGRTVIGFSCTSTADIIFALPLARLIKERYGCYVVMGGYAPSTCYDLLMRHYAAWLDGIVLGAGEYPLRALMEHLDEGRVAADRVPNLVWLRDGEMVVNPRCVPLPSNELPVLDISSLPYRHLYPYIAYNSSVGCPYQCHFCVERDVHPAYEVRRAELVAADLQRLRELSGLRHIGFHDPIFGQRRDLRTLLDRLNDMGVSYIFQTRVDALDTQWYPLLSRGCRFIFFGLEGVSPASLARMNKTPHAERYLQMLETQMQHVFAAGILPVVALLPNYPLNTRADAEACVAIARRLRALHEQGGAQGGLIFTPFQFRIEYGSTYQRELPQLMAQGLTARPYFPPEYRGIPIPAEFMLQVENASADLTLHDYEQVFAEIMRQSVVQPAQLAAFARYYVIDLDPFVAGKIIYAPFFTDADRDVVSVQGLMREFARYSEILTAMVDTRFR